MRRLTILLAFVVACSPAETAQSPNDSGGAAASGGAGGAGPEGVSLLASGEFAVPAANAFGDPGFHETFDEVVPLPAAVVSAAGKTLTVRLWDASRPEQTCTQDHPLSGCATVDWSDLDTRPNVPPGGVFDNRLRVVLQSGARDFHLSESLALADVPDIYSPT